MTTIILITLAWYLTKLYYTKDLKVHLNDVDPSMGLIRCSKCAQTIYTDKANFRSSFYCIACS